MKIPLFLTTLFLAGYAVALPVDAATTEVMETQAGCDEVMVIFARGTDEPGGGNGGILVGDRFISALKDRLPGKVSADGVPYGASIGGYLSGGSTGGAATMARMLGSLAKRCPDADIVAGGYSQGGQVLHRAMKLISANTASHIKAVIIYGDPDKDQRMPHIDPSIVTTICAPTDPICRHIPIPLGSHLTYGLEHAKQGAKDVAATLGLS